MDDNKNLSERKFSEILWHRALRATRIYGIGVCATWCFCVYVTRIIFYLWSYFSSAFQLTSSRHLVEISEVHNGSIAGTIFIMTLTVIFASCHILLTTFVSKELRSLFVNMVSKPLQFIRMLCSPWLVLWLIWNLLFPIIMIWNFLMVLSYQFASFVNKEENGKQYLPIETVLCLFVGIFCACFAVSRHLWSFERRPGSSFNRNAKALAFEFCRQLFHTLLPMAVSCTVVGLFVFVAFGYSLVLLPLSNITGALLPITGPFGLAMFMMDFSLLFLLFCIAVLILNIYWLCFFSLDTCLNEAFSFPIPTMTAVCDPNELYLQMALSCKTDPLLRQLAFRDLLSVAKFSFERRRLIFAISHPGGHPRNWNDISHCCYETALQLNSCLCKAHELLVARSEGQGLSGLSQRDVCVYPKPAFGDRLRSNDYQPVMAEQRIPSVIPSVQKETQAGNFFVRFFWALVDHFRFRGGVLPSVSIEHLVRLLEADADVNCSNIEALSFLLTASLKEDAYGVVQRDLPMLLGVLLELNANFERFCRLTGNYPPRPSSTSSPNESLKLQLYLCLSTSTSRVTRAFGGRLKEVLLAPEHKALLERFMIDS